MIHTVTQFQKTDCQLLEPIHIFVGIYQATGGDPCTTGCAYFNGGACAAYRKLNIPSVSAVQQASMETVRETAIRLGISISEVRRRRRNGV